MYVAHLLSMEVDVKALKIFSMIAVWFAILFVGFSFCHYSFDASTWGVADRVLMIFAWCGLSFASTGYILESKK